MAATDKKLSVLVDDQLPDFIKEEGPLFQEFIKAYYSRRKQVKLWAAVTRGKSRIRYPCCIGGTLLVRE